MPAHCICDQHETQRQAASKQLQSDGLVPAQHGFHILLGSNMACSRFPYTAVTKGPMRHGSQLSTEVGQRP